MIFQGPLTGLAFSEESDVSVFAPFQNLLPQRSATHKEEAPLYNYAWSILTLL